MAAEDVECIRWDVTVIISTRFEAVTVVLM
jgi:hypothetical protein